MKAAFELLGGEPWCFTPEAIGKLTDWQIWEVYVRPVSDRQRRERRRRYGQKPRDPYKGIPSREEFIAGGLHFGLTEEQAAKQFDDWAATEEGQKMLAERAVIEAQEIEREEKKHKQFG